MWKKWLLLLLATLVSDVTMGRVATYIMSRPTRATLLAQANRTPHELYHHDLKKGISSSSVWGQREVSFYTNSLGFRDRSPETVPRQAVGPRILLIGDSFTEGLGVEYEDSFAGIVADRLVAQGTEVLNAAAVSYSPSIYYRKIRYLLEEVALQFDEVITFIDISDIQDEAIHYDLDDDGTVIDSPYSNNPHIFTGLVEQEIVSSRPKEFKTHLKEHSVILRLADTIRDRLAAAKDGDHRTLYAVGLDRSSWTIDEELLKEYGVRGLSEAGNSHGRPSPIAARGKDSTNVSGLSLARSDCSRRPGLVAGDFLAGLGSDSWGKVHRSFSLVHP